MKVCRKKKQGSKMKVKNYNMELIRTASFVMVVIIHVTNYFCRAYDQLGRGEYLFSVILDTVSRVSVPCFFMLSGALLLGRVETIHKAGMRLLRFMIVLLFWSIVYYIFNIYYMGSSYDLSDIFYVPTESHLWYLYAMIPIYMVLPFFQVMCRGMDKKLDLVLIVVGCFAAAFTYFSSFLNEEAYYDIPIIGDKVYAFYFFLGYFICKYKNKINGHFWRYSGIFICSTALNIGITVGLTYQKGEHFERLLEYGCPLVIISGVSFFCMLMQLGDGNLQLKNKTKKLIDLWCGCSFGIYLIHIMFLDTYKKYIEPEQISAWIAVPSLVIGIISISFLCVYLIRKLPFGRYIS
jgi:surface polysaccharide O-acyltransferase-like enzyme